MTQSKISFSPVLLTPDLFQKASEMSARAFFTDPMGAYWVPGEKKRMTKLTGFFRATFKYGHGYAETYTVPGSADGLAMWFAPGVKPFPMGRMLRTGLFFSPFAFGWQGFNNFMTMSGLTEKAHKQVMKEPHWHLAFLCTDPPKQGQGIGTALMKPVLDRADAAGQPCYLETMTEKDVTFYMKRGFKVAWEGSVPKGGLMIWTMRRDPQR